MINSITRYWQKSSLAQQFAVAATMILLPTALFLGWWIADSLRTSLINNTASTIVIYMRGLVGPRIAEIAMTGELSNSSEIELDRLLETARQESSIVSMKIWRPDGTIIYSTFKDMIGKKFPVTDSLEAALKGTMFTDFQGEPEDEEVHELQTGKPLMAVYNPVYLSQPSPNSNSSKIVAVSEFYLNAESVIVDISNARYKNWLIVGTLLAAIILVLSGFIHRGSRTILAQQKLLGDKVVDLEETLLVNESLRFKLREANQSVASVNERVLQQVGTDLHDGPAQTLAYAVLKMSKFQNLTELSKAQQSEITATRRFLYEALKDVRKVSSGLMLPELENASLRETIALAIENHKKNTGTDVIENLDKNARDVPYALKICAYRFVQESLNNAYKHANGAGQKVSLLCGSEILVEVEDHGPGLVLSKSKARRLGLSGMFARVEALGGSLTIDNPVSGGTVLRARFPLT
jgi:signal transduction histidine kinase